MARVSSPADDPSVLAQGPIRTCIGCRQRDRPAVLLRIVVVKGSAGMVVPDIRRRLPGRGAWLHPSLGCFDAAERRRAFARSLRAGGALDASMVRQHLLDIGAGTAARTTAPQSAESPMSRREQVDPT